MYGTSLPSPPRVRTEPIMAGLWCAFHKVGRWLARSCTGRACHITSHQYHIYYCHDNNTVALANHPKTSALRLSISTMEFFDLCLSQTTPSLPHSVTKHTLRCLNVLICITLDKYYELRRIDYFAGHPSASSNLSQSRLQVSP